MEITGKQNKRYPFKKVSAVVLLIMVAYTLIVLLLAYTVKLPPGLNVSKINISLLLLSQAVSTVFNIFFYYITLNHYHGLMVKKRGMEAYALYTTKVVIVCVLYLVLSGYYTNNFTMPDNAVSIVFKMISHIFSLSFLIGISLGIVHINNLRDEKEKRKNLERQKMELEIEKMQINYHFLKSQINPHFLHNTLSFFYARLLRDSPELADGIFTLSKIMRYSLDTENADGKAWLKDEIDHLRNVIKINQLRFSHQLQVKFDVHGIVHGVAIIPFVLITIAENAFKHGDLKDPEHPIHIQLTIEENNRLTFYCRNKKKTGSWELSTGIGLQNIRKRLDHIYGNQFEFDIKDETAFYTIKLVIFKV
jgi:two-component system, LytTR family, sensor kinase